MIILSTTLQLITNTFIVCICLRVPSSLNGFSFTIDYQAGDISYNAYFDDHQGGIYNTSGYTVTPEPISSVLFLFGGAVFAVRRHLRKRGSKKY